MPAPPPTIPVLKIPPDATRAEREQIVARWIVACEQCRARYANPPRVTSLLGPFVAAFLIGTLIASCFI